MFRRLGRPHATLALLAIGVALGMSTTALGFGPVERTFRPAGDTRYAFASANVSSPTTTTSSTMGPMAGMQTSITIPTGRKADLFITFSAELNGCNGIYVRAIVDSSANIAAPGQALLFSHTGGSAEAHGFTWYRTVGDGAHTVKIQWLVLTGCSQGFAGVRSLFVTANIY